MDDAELVRLAQQGNSHAIGTLYDRHQPHIYRFVWSRVRHQQTAEDMTGEIFTRMVTNLSGYQITGIPFRAWLYRIARNLIVDHFRQHSERLPLPLDAVENMTEETDSMDSLLQQKITVEYVEQALDRIDPEQREVVVMRFLVGLPLKEVALTLDKTVPAVKSLQHRGLAALRMALQVEVEQ
jgi:RNA polymerase sigma-70 factor (ECF subfamily)